MKKTILVNDIKVKGSGLNVIGIDIPINKIPTGENIKESLKLLLKKEFELTFKNQQIELSDEIKENENKDFSFITLHKDGTVFFFSNETFFIKSIEEIKSTATIDDEFKSDFWDNQPINTFTEAYLYFRDCMDDYYLLIRLNPKERKVESVIKNDNDDRMFFFEEEFCFNKKDLFHYSQAPFHYSKFDNLIKQDFFSFLITSQKVYEELHLHDIDNEEEIFCDFIKDRGITLIKEYPMVLDKYQGDFVDEDDPAGKKDLVRIFHGRSKNNNKEVIIRFHINSKNVKIYEKGKPGVVYFDRPIIKASIADKKNFVKLYTKRNIPAYQYELNEELFKTYIDLKLYFSQQLNLKFNILFDTKEVTEIPTSFSLDFSEVDRVKFVDIYADNIKRMIIDHLSSEPIELEDFILMLKQFAEDGIKEPLLIICKEEE